MTTTNTPAPTASQTPTSHGRRVQLGAYTTDTGQARILIGQQIDGIVHLYDEPVDEDAPTYLIEQGLETNSELEALLADYLTTATRLGSPPMHGWF